MKIFLIFLALVNYVFAASVLLPLISVVRTPEDDSAVVDSIQIKGNFAYSTVEGHAYKAITPLLGSIAAPQPLQPVNVVYLQN